MRLFIVVVALSSFAGCPGCDEPLEGLDAGAPDGGSLAIGDAGDDVDDAGGGDDDAGEVVLDSGFPCVDLEAPGDDDKPRVILVGHRFGADAGADGYDIRGLTLDQAGAVTDDGVRLNVGTPPARIAFFPAGSVALVLGEDGLLVSVAVNGAADLNVIDAVQLGSADYGDLRIQGTRAIIAGSNSVASGGIDVVDVACDGALSVDEDAFHSLRLTHSFAFLPGDRMVVWGGQAVFDPIVDEDTRLFDIAGAPAEIADFDLWQDFHVIQRADASPDGKYAMAPNQALFGTEVGQVLVVEMVAGDVVQERTRIPLPGATEALFSPDGQWAIVSQFDEDKITMVDVDQGSFTVSGEITGIGLADQMAMVTRGPLTGRVFITSVDASGNIAIVDFDDVAGAVYVDQVDLGAGNTNIPGAIAVAP